jgi:hypothetical protein
MLAAFVAWFFFCPFLGIQPLLLFYAEWRWHVIAAILGALSYGFVAVLKLEIDGIARGRKDDSDKPTS